MARLIAAIHLASYPAMVAAALVPSPVAMIGALAASQISDEVLYSVNRKMLRQMRQLGLGVGVRFLTRELLVIVLALRSPGFSTANLTVLVSGMLLIHVARADYEHITRRIATEQRAPILARNLPLPVERIMRSRQAPRPLHAAGQVLRRGTGRTILHFDGFIAYAAVLGAANGEGGAVTGGAVAAGTCALLVLGYHLRRARVLRFRPSNSDQVEAITIAVHALAPEVVLYFSGPAEGTYQVDMWLSTLDQLKRRSLIVLREPVHFWKLAEATTPVICARDATNLISLIPASVKVALYPANVGKNIHMLRTPGVKHVFIGHGDSDKGSSFNPFSKVYDKIFVAGEAGRDRYRRAGVALEDERFDIVGRPQLEEIEPRRAHHDGTLTVLYAPTWEGWFDDQNHYTSLELIGPTLIERLLAAPSIRVIFRPHPLTGTTSRAMRRIAKGITESLQDARGNMTAREGGPSLFECFNMSDVLVTDISSVVSDYLRADKPYVVTNPTGMDEDSFREEHPSAGGGYILGPACAELDAILRDIRTRDSLAGERAALRAHLLGPTEDAVARFDDAVGRLARSAPGARMERGPVEVRARVTHRHGP